MRLLNRTPLMVSGSNIKQPVTAIHRPFRGGPSPLPYDPGHVYRVYVQGQGRPVRLAVSDSAHGDNSGAFTVRIQPAP